MKKINMSLHVIGLSTVVAAAFFLAWVFLMIVLQGHFTVGEDNLWIRYCEVALVIYGACYAVFLWVSFMRYYSA